MENEKGTKEAHGFESNALPMRFYGNWLHSCSSVPITVRTSVRYPWSVLMIVMGFIFKPLVRIVEKPYIPCCDIKKLID